MNVRMTNGGVALALAAALAVSGCGGNGSDTATGGAAPAGAATTAAEAAKDARAALVEAATKLQQDTFKSTIDMGASGTMVGVMDPRKKVGEFTMEAESEGTKLKTEMRMIDGTNYIRITAPGVSLPGMDGKTWRKLGSQGGPGTLGTFNGSDTVKSLEAAADVQWAGQDAVTGTIDLAKAGKQLGMGAEVLSKLSTTTIPFEAGFDGEGRLVRYALTMPAVGKEPATKMNMTYSDFGLPVSVQAPAKSEIAKS